MSNPLSRAASVRKMILNESIGNGSGKEGSVDATTLQQNRRVSIATLTPIEGNNPDYNSLDMISPLPLYALFSTDNAAAGFEKADNMDKKETSVRFFVLKLIILRII